VNPRGYAGMRERATKRSNTAAAVELTFYNERDDGLSISHAIMRGGPQFRLSPGLGATCVSRRLRP